jgi:hypothetical protein
VKAGDRIRYKRMSTPRATYQLLLDGKPIALVMQTKGRQWVAATILPPILSVPACASRHEAGMALLGKLNELGSL